MYFAVKLNWYNTFRRLKSKGVLANLHGVDIRTWYYNPSVVKRWAGKKFQLVGTRPVGILLPPSYLENFFEKRKKTLRFLNKIDRVLSNMSFLSYFSDHYIIDLKLK